MSRQLLVTMSCVSPIPYDLESPYHLSDCEKANNLGGCDAYANPLLPVHTSNPAENAFWSDGVGF